MVLKTDCREKKEQKKKKTPIPVLHGPKATASVKPITSLSYLRYIYYFFLKHAADTNT